MPLYPPPLPAPFLLYDPTSLAAAAGTLPTAGATFFVGYVLYAQVTISRMRASLSGVPTGNIDMGIYDATAANGAPNNLLGHTGAIAAATGLFTQNLLANVTLPPGQYWLAFLDTVADSVQFRSTTQGGMGPIYRTTATNLTVLPSTAGAVAQNGNAVAVEALILNSYP